MAAPLERTRWVVTLAIAGALFARGMVSSPIGDAEPLRGTTKPQVACWNSYFPFEPEGPDFLASPRKCLWYKRKAQTYAEGALLGKRMDWRWRGDHARARGTLKVPGVGDESARGWVELTRPTESCGRLVFSRIRYRLKAPSGRSGSYPIYTCRSDPD